MAAMLQIPQVLPRLSGLGSAKAVQCPHPRPKIGDKSQQIPCYGPVYPRVQPPGMAADKCIYLLVLLLFLKTFKSGHKTKNNEGHA